MATNQTYVKTEVVGSSSKSVSDAIESAIATASRHPGSGGARLGVHPVQRRLCRSAGRGPHRQPWRACA